MQEEWREVVGWEGYYEVSSQGNVRSVDRVVMRSNGRPHTWRGKNLSPGTQKRTGYKYLVLSRPGEKKLTVRVHRLVAEAFIPNPDRLPLVLHGDGTRTNNHVDNLRWGTTSDNLKDAVKHGTYRNGWSDRTHCSNGHEFTEENTREGARQRHCRTCSRENMRRYRSLRKAA